VSRVEDVRSYDHFIGGAWTAPAGGGYLQTANPYSGEVNALFAEGTDEDVDRAARAAWAAFSTTPWSRQPHERARLLRRLADFIDADAARLAAIESGDNGKTIREERGMFGAVGSYFRYAASLAETLTGDVPVGADPNVLSLTLREPFGVIGVQTPWNTPGVLLAQPVAPALAAGNTIVVKPSELAPLSILELASLFEAAGFPPGVFNVVTGLGPVVGAALCAHPLVAKLTFTGSPVAGRLVATQAAQRLVPVTMELGGKSANIVFPDADLDAAAAAVAAGFIAAGGQSCVAGSRAVVHESIYDDMIERLDAHAKQVRMGDPAEPTTDMGPVCTQDQFTRICELVRIGLDEGARLVAGGRQSADLDGTLFFPPTILADVSSQMTIAREEVFGPVVCVIPFRDEQHAVEIANDTVFGLAGGVWTRDLDRAHRVARAMRAGTIWVNHYRRGDPAFPFGGYGESGYGRFSGIDGYREMTRVKSVQILTGQTPASQVPAEGGIA
jgi:acyl-CoA reductase-like NAD-dependent aldehyde dehydrogenase